MPRPFRSPLVATPLVALSARFRRSVVARSIVGAFLAASAVSACDGNSPVASEVTGSHPVGFAVASSLFAAPGATVEATVTYVRPGGSTATIATASLTTGTADTQSLPISADVAGCLNDAASARTTCRVTLTLRLKRDGRLLDENSQGFDITAATRNVQVSEIALYEVSTVAIAPTTITNFEPGDSQTLTATATDRSGTAVTGRTTTWDVVSGNVTVTAAGLLRAVGAGDARVRATIGGRTRDLTFTVSAPSVATISIAPLDTTILTGGTVSYRLVARSSAGDVLTGRTITLTSSSTTVATVAGNVVTGVGVGLTNITARSTDGRGGTTITATTTLRVDAPPPIQVDRATVALDSLTPNTTGSVQKVGVTTTVGKTITSLRTAVTYSPNVTPWLNATLDATTTPTTLNLQASSGSLPAGDYAADVRLTSATDPHVPATVHVTLRVVTLLGRFSGLVLNAVNGLPINFAIVTIRRADGTVADVDTSASNGRYTSVPLPAGTYSISYAVPGFILTSLSNQTLTVGVGTPITPLPPAQVVPTGSGSGIITGSVRDATSNGYVPTATLELRSGGGNLTGSPIATVVSDGQGFYNFPAQPSGTYTIRGTKANYADGSVNVTVPGTAVSAPTLFMSPGSGTVAWRFVLSWGQQPYDLDAHLTGPIANSANRFHVYFVDRGSLTVSPFAQLDFDVVEGSGPETITMSQQIAGVYRFYVYNYSQEVALSTSAGRVDVYKGNALVNTFFVPQGAGTYWTVFEISGNVVTPINTLGTVTPALSAPSSPGAAAKLSPAATAAASEWFNLFRQMPQKPARLRR